MLGGVKNILRVKNLKSSKVLAPGDSIVRSFIPSGTFDSSYSNHSHCIPVLSIMVRLSKFGRTASHIN